MPHKSYSDNFSTYAVSKLPVYRDDFSGADNWVDNDSSKIGVNTTNDRIEATFEQIDGSNDATVYDLGIVSDSKWTLRFTMQRNGASSSAYGYLGISDSDQTVGQSSAQDFIGFWTEAGLPGRISTVETNGVSLPVTAGDAVFDLPSPTSINYMEIVRTSRTSFVIRQYSDSTYSTISQKAVATISPNISGLRYIKILNRQASNALTLSYFFDDFQFWNGIDKGAVTFLDDFSGVDNWVDADSSKAGVNITTDVLDFNVISDNTNDATSYDLQNILGAGINVSDDNWVLRYEMKFSTASNSAGNTFFVGLSSAPSSTGFTTAQDVIGVEMSKTATFNAFFALDTNGVVPQTAPIDATGINVTWNTVDTYYFEIKRLSKIAYSVECFTGGFPENGGLSLGKINGVTTSNVSGLRYIRYSNWIQSVATSWIGTIDNIEFYNGVSVANTPLKPIPELDFDFTSATGWVQTGTGVTVDTVDQRIEGWGADGTDRRVTYDMGTNGILSEQDWTIEFEYEFSASNLPGHGIMLLSDLNQDTDATSGNDVVTVYQGTSVNELVIRYADNGDIGSSGIVSTGIPISVNTRYYVKLERIRGAIFKLSVFTDPDFTNHVSISPVFLTGVPSTLDGLRYLHSQNFSGGSSLRTLTGFLKNLKVYRIQRGTEKDNKWLVIG